MLQTNKQRRVIYSRQQSLHQYKHNHNRLNRDGTPLFVCFLFVFARVDASHVYVGASALGCFHSHISIRTFRRAMTRVGGQLRGERVRLQWRNQIWQSLEEGAGKQCSECGCIVHNAKQGQKSVEKPTSGRVDDCVHDYNPNPRFKERTFQQPCFLGRGHTISASTPLPARI